MQEIKNPTNNTPNVCTTTHAMKTIKFTPSEWEILMDPLVNIPESIVETLVDDGETSEDEVEANWPTIDHATRVIEFDAENEMSVRIIQDAIDGNTAVVTAKDARNDGDDEKKAYRRTLAAARSLAKKINAAGVAVEGIPEF